MELLGDPAKDRQAPQVPPPPLRFLDPDLMFPESNKYKPDWKLIRDHLQREGRIGKTELIKLVRMAQKVFKNEGNLLYLQDPLTIVGDIHGQFYDLLKLVEVGGDPESQKYVFLGDYVDRGSFSIEVITLLYALKINYPKTIYMLRGNHECRQLTSYFNFLEECLYKYDQEIYEVITDSFDSLPLACIVNNQFIALHGGISPELQNVHDINTFNRFIEPPKQGLFCDIMWADPVENDEGSSQTPFVTNEVRGCSYFYGQEATGKFLEKNNLISVIRAHEVQVEGYKMHKWSGAEDFPMVITIFSAPNYCDVYNNKGAVIKFDNNALNIQQFNYNEHPYLLPNFMDIFSWSIPFVAEKVTEMLFHILNVQEGENLSDDEVQESDIQKFNEMIQKPEEKKSGDILKKKIKFVQNMMKMQRAMRAENESIVQLNGVCPDSKIPKGLLKDLKDSAGVFNNARKADIVNERRPELQGKTK